MSSRRATSRPTLDFPPHPLREYAVLGDGERGVIVDPRGNLAWMCFPRWDSDAVFSSLVGGNGTYAISPIERSVWGGYYEPGTLVWRSRWVTETGTIVECRDALALPATKNQAVVLRRVHALHGKARVGVAFAPCAGYGSERMRRISRDESGNWHGRIGSRYFCWMGAAKARPEPDGHGGRVLYLEIEVRAGAYHDFVFVVSEQGDISDPPDPDTAWSSTLEEWRQRVPERVGTIAHRDARHACAVLTGLASSEGGMVAAATMSLPEGAEEGRNFDYRYVWIRDQCYAGRGAFRAGVPRLLDIAVDVVSTRILEHGIKLRPAYTTTGDPVPSERRLNLPGYPGGTDIVGNRVNDQFQLDAFGEALLLFADAARCDRLEGRDWEAVDTAVDVIEQRWCKPDAGIWELDPKAWTHSRLICVAGLRAVADQQPAGDRAAAWLTLADRITAHTSSHALHPTGRWQRADDDPRVDAALLLPAIRGAIPADDRRSTSTLAAVHDELAEDGYCYRYRVEDQPLGEVEGAFLLCGFLMSLAYRQQGNHTAAARWFERTRATCGPPGLFAEEFDVTQRQLRGNLPQAFVHALMLECASVEPEQRTPT